MALSKAVWKDGVTAGVLGAAGVAVWLLMVDTIAGHPFFTPELLGRGVLRALGRGIEDHGTAYFVVGYTILHVIAFMVVGCVASIVVTATRRAPQFTAAILRFFAVFETGFYFLALALSANDVLGTLSWYQIGAANLVAAALMGTYLLRRHPEFAGNLDHALDGTS